MARERITPAHLTGHLQRLLCSLTTPQAWEDLITAADRIGCYTARNRAIILAQYPQATTLAGSSAWADLGREIVGGQRGLGVLAVTRRQGGADAREGRTGAEDVFAPDLRPPHEQDIPSQAHPEPVPYRGESGATVVKVWDVSQTVKVTDCAACDRAAEAPCVPGCRGVPRVPAASVPADQWWQLAEELPEGFDPEPVWAALHEVAFLV